MTDTYLHLKLDISLGRSLSHLLVGSSFSESKVLLELGNLLQVAVNLSEENKMSAFVNATHLIEQESLSNNSDIV